MRQMSLHPDLLWERIVTVAVTSNEYEEELRSNVLALVKGRAHDRLLVFADDLSRTVYGDPATHYRMHQLAALIRKYPNLNITVNPEVEARKVFTSAEWRCKWTNRKFCAIERSNSGMEASAIHTMRKWIGYVLRNKSDRDQDGPAPTPNLTSIMSKCDFTGGASVGVHGSATNIYRKLTQATEGWTVTPGVLTVAAEAVWNNFQLTEYLLRASGNAGPVEGDPVCLDVEKFIKAFAQSVRTIDYNKIAFVPKTAKVHRTIAAEPTLNTFVQKGIDIELRDRLKAVGLDLSQQSPNQEMARKGSIEEEDPYCTIDLSSASDTLATEVVRVLLPPEWYELLDKCRSQYFQFPDGEHGRYEKFVSMGNGFCFPLQTMIFASICHAASVELDVPLDFRVYGDDIIVRRSIFERVIALLRFFGFIPNPRKTFSEGPFRESCGADWHSGLNVRPIFLDHRLENLEQIFGFHNQSLRRESYVSDYFASIRSLLYEGVPKPARFVQDFDPSVPCGARTGETIDGAFWAPMDTVMASDLCFYNVGTMSWGYTALRSESIVDKVDTDPSNSNVLNSALLMSALRGSDSSRPFTLRYRTSYKPRLINLYVR